LCAKLAGEGRRRVVQKFDWEIVAEKYAGEYKKIHSGMSLHEKEL
jgi:glycosyltransferase involved in cell wall biosynthesis